MPVHPYVIAADQAIQEGKLEKAQDILISFVAQHPDDGQAWFLLSLTFTEPHDIVRCLRNTLTLEPQHDDGRIALQQLEQKTGQKPIEVMQIGPNSASLGRICPYCSGDFQISQEVLVCPACQTGHHCECWIENGYRCATMLCKGFSLREVKQQTIPVEPAASDMPMPPPVVIRKEDIGKVQKVTRKDQEQQFQRRLLLMALLAEEGEIADDVARTLPAVDDIIEQIQRDKKPEAQGDVSLETPPASDQLQNRGEPHVFVPDTGQASHIPNAYAKTSVVTGVIPILPEQVQPLATTANQEKTTCPQCGHPNENSLAHFCRKCGARYSNC